MSVWSLLAELLVTLTRCSSRAEEPRPERRQDDLLRVPLLRQKHGKLPARPHQFLGRWPGRSHVHEDRLARSPIAITPPAGCIYRSIVAFAGKHLQPMKSLGKTLLPENLQQIFRET